MKTNHHGVERAIRLFGSQRKLAEAAGCSQNAICVALHGRPGPTVARKIEAATNGAVTLSELRPDIWPEGAA